jgi:hypothetical protein
MAAAGALLLILTARFPRLIAAPIDRMGAALDARARLKSAQAKV